MKIKKEQYIAIPYRVLDSPDYRGLTPQARDILHLFIRHYYPSHPNRLISLTYTEITDIYGYCRQTIAKSFRELVDADYIKLESKGGLHKSSQYILNGDKISLRDS